MGRGKAFIVHRALTTFFSIFAQREPLWKSENELFISLSKPLREHRDPWDHN